MLTGAGTARGGGGDDRRARADRRSSRSAPTARSRRIDGRAVDGRAASTSARRSTPPAPATCSSPPGRGATRRASRVDDALRWAALYAALSVRVPDRRGRRDPPRRVPRGGRPPRPPRPARTRRAGRLSRRGARASRASAVTWRSRAARVALAGAVAASCSSPGAAASRLADRRTRPRAPPARPRRRARPPALCGRAEGAQGRDGRRAGRDRALRARAARGPATLWTHNDSGDGPRVLALDRRGRLQREVAVSGAEAVDWEDIAIRGRTLYVGDIGDNLAQRPNVAVYRFAEPPPGRPSVAAERIDLRYPDGAARRRDAARRPAHRRDRRSSPRTSAAAPASTSRPSGAPAQAARRSSSASASC